MDAANNRSNRLISGLRVRLLAYFVGRTHNRDDAQDLAQETLFRLYCGKRMALENKEAYAFGIAANVYREQVRKAVTRRTYEPEIGRKLSESTAGVLALDPERIVGSRMELERVSRALEDMPARTSTIFILFKVSGMRQADIAQQLGISVSSVEKHLVKASVLLAKRVNQT